MSMMPRPIVSKLWAKNFRSLEDVEVSLGRLTVLVGPNASGKSNVLDAARFVRQCLVEGVSSALKRRNGFAAIVHSTRRRRMNDLQVGVEVDGLELPGTDLRFRADYSFRLVRDGQSDYRISRESGRGWASFDSTFREGLDLAFEIEEGRFIRPQVLSSLYSLLGDVMPGRLMLEAPPILLGLASLDPTRVSTDAALIRQASDTASQSNVHRLWSRVKDHIQHLGFYHVEPDAVREPQKISSTSLLQEHGENMAAILRGVVAGSHPYHVDLKEALGKLVPGITGVRVKSAGGYLVVELEHDHLGNGSKGVWLGLSQESDGTLRLLGILAALYQTPTPSLIAIEEPESSIHPGALAVLADLLMEASHRSQVIITTHSADLIERFSVDSLRVVRSVNGATTVGMVAEHQREAVRRGLFSAGEIHRMEGLRPVGSAES